jgi:hypothetical protein
MVPLGAILAIATLVAAGAPPTAGEPPSRAGGALTHKETTAMLVALPRPASEKIPSAAKTLRITAVGALRTSGQPTPIPPIAVTREKTVRAIATAIDELPRLQPGAYSCPSDNGSSVSFAFRAAQGESLLAWVKAEATGCGIVEVKIGDREEPLLSDGYRLLRKVEKLLGSLGRQLPKPL